ncbi:MAG: hypothetical protein ACLPY1_05385 [Terracidiphilus sp.]
MRVRICGILTLAAIACWSLSVAGQVAETRARASLPATNGQAARLPYTAEFRTTHVQTLADGSTITRETTEVHARDSQGRTLIMSSTTPAMEDQTVHSSVNINDPVAHTHTWWAVPGQRVTVSNIPEIGSARSSCAASNLAAMPQPASDARMKPVTEDLGKQTFQGVEAQGHRISWTIPARTIGNSDDLVRTEETWFSTAPGLSGINVRRVYDDPQTGRTTRELVKFNQGEPDASLFQPPADYEVVTQETHEEFRCP